MPLTPEEEDELKRRQLQQLREAEEWQKSKQSFGQGCGCFFCGLPLAICAIFFVAWLVSLVWR